MVITLMTYAQTRKDAPHARIYASWVELATWRALSHPVRSLLTAMLAHYRKGNNGIVKWPCSRIAMALDVSRDTASRLLKELEANGWIKPVTLGTFGGAAKAGTFALTMWPNDADHSPATNDYLYISPYLAKKPRSKLKRPLSDLKDSSVR